MDLMANLLCSFVLLEKPWAEVRKHLDLTNFEKVAERINGAKSVLWTINHLGNWELFIFCAALVRSGRHGVIYRALPNRFIDAHIRRARESTGLELIERKHGLAQSTSILKAGGMLAILVDQHAGDKGIWTPFFNRLASTTPLTSYPRDQDRGRTFSGGHPYGRSREVAFGGRRIRAEMRSLD